MKKFFFLAITLMMGMSAMAYEGKAYAWPNTTPEGSSLAGGVYVSYNDNTPKDVSEYHAYDASSRTSWASSYKAYFAAHANDGYAFMGWYSDEAYTQLTSTKVEFDDFSAKNDLTFYALFAPSMVDSVVAEGVIDTIRVAGPYTATVQFAVSHADAAADFDLELVGGENWTIVSSSVANNILSVTVQFSCDNSVVNFENSTMVAVTSKGTSTGLADGEKSYMYSFVKAVVRLDPVTVVYAYTGANEYKVNDAAIDLAALWTSNSHAERVYSLVSYTESGINNQGGVNPALEGALLSFGKAGKVVVKVAQEAAGACLAGSQEMEITISKLENALAWKFADVQTNEWTLGLNDGVYVSTQVTNPNAEVDVEPIAGEEIATYYPEQGAIYSSFVKGVAMFQAVAAEDYLYEEASQIASVTVSTVDGCNLYSDTTKYTFNDDDYTPVEIYFDGKPQSMTFDLRKRTYSNNGTFTITALYEDSTAVLTSSSLYNLSSEWSTVTLPLDADVIGVRFSAANFGLIAELYVKNVEVSSVSKMEADQEVIDFGHCKYAVIGQEVPYTATFNVDWITCDTLIRVESTLEHVSVSVDPIDARAHAGQTTITISYLSYEPETVEGKVVVYTPYESAEVIVKAITDNSATDMEVVPAEPTAQKILRRGMLIIRRNGKAYNAMGAMVE